MMFANVVDMGGAWVIKYVSILIGAGYILLRLKSIYVNKNVLLIVFLLFGIFPFWALLNGVASGGAFGVARSQVTPFFVGLIYYLLLARGGSLHAIDAFLKSILVVAIATIVLVLGLFLFPEFPPLSGAFQYLIGLDDIQGKFGRRGLGPITWYAVYFKSTLFFVPAFVYYLYNRKFGYCAVFFAALTLAISKAGILICGIAVVWFVITSGSLRAQFGVTALIGGLVAAVLSLVDVEVTMAYVNYFVDTLTGQAETTQIRLGHIRSFIDLMGSNPTYVVWGQGVGTGFYSIGMGRFTYDIELDHLDVIRQLGLPWFIAFSTCVAYVTIRLIRRSNSKEKGLGYAMAALYVAAGTNPLLITPLFMMLLAASYHYAQGRI